MLIINQTRIDKIAGSGYYESFLWTNQFKRVIFLCFSSKNQFLWKINSKNHVMIASPFDLSPNALISIVRLARNYVILLRTIQRIIDVFKVSLIRTENIILEGVPTWLISQFKSIPYSIFLVGFERKVVLSKFKGSKLSKFIAIFIKAFEFLVLKKANFTFAISDELYELAKNLHLKNIVVSPNYIDLTIWKERTDYYSDFTQPIKILYAGRFEKEKGIEVLLKAFARVSDTHQNLQLNLVGAGSLIDWVKQFVSDQNLQDRVHLLGYIENYLDLPAIFESNDVYILPSYTEGMPASLMEAMATGSTCIASAVGMIPKMIVPEENGFLVQPGNSELLAQKIEYLLANPEKIEQIGRKARKKIEYLTKNYVNLHKSVYRHILQR